MDPLELQAVPVINQTQPGIVHDDEQDRNAVFLRSQDLQPMHMEATVAGDDHRRAFRIRHFGGNSDGQAASHCPEVDVDVEGIRRKDVQVMDDISFGLGDIDCVPCLLGKQLLEFRQWGGSFLSSPSSRPQSLSAG